MLGVPGGPCAKDHSWAHGNFRLLKYKRRRSGRNRPCRSPVGAEASALVLAIGPGDFDEVMVNGQFSTLRFRFRGPFLQEKSFEHRNCAVQVGLVVLRDQMGHP